MAAKTSQKTSKKASLTIRKKLRKAATRATKKAPLGAGIRFKAVEAAARAGGARKPAAVAAAIGRKKYGKKRFQAMGVAGKKRKKGKK